MAYVLLPDGFTLKKVSKPEQNAVDDYFGRERRSDYIDKLIQNPQIITVIAGIATGAVLAKTLADIELPEIGPITTEKILTKYNENILLFNPITAPLAVLDKFGVVDIPSTPDEIKKWLGDLL